jgi:hypothetical protein
MSWKSKYEKLIKKCEKHGYIVEEHGHDVLKDYGGMNPAAAKAFGFVMPNDRLYVAEDSDWKTKYNDLKHELKEVILMEDGDENYWDAHCESLKIEED